MIIDVQFNQNKNWVHNVVYMGNEKNWNLLFLLLCLYICLSLFFVLPYFFGIVCFVTTTLTNSNFKDNYVCLK